MEGHTIANGIAHDAIPSTRNELEDITDSMHLLGKKPTFENNFPHNDSQDDVLQDAEFFDVVVKQRIRIHDDDSLFAYPDLYDHVIEGALQCQLPREQTKELVKLLKQQLCSDAPNLSRCPLHILDVAAGNGRVGAELRSQLGTSPGIQRLVGTDLLESARVATLRDRKPNPYDEYMVADLLNVVHSQVSGWYENSFDVVTVCAALGPGEGDLPLDVLDAAIDFLKKDGLLVFTVNEGTQSHCQGRRYSEFLDSLRKGAIMHWNGMIKVHGSKYKHRLSVKGDCIEYSTLVYKRVSTPGRSKVLGGDFLHLTRS